MIQISHACPPLAEYLFSLWAKSSQPWTDCSAFCALRLWEWQIDLKIIIHELLSCRAGRWVLQIWNGNQENRKLGSYFWIHWQNPPKKTKTRYFFSCIKNIKSLKPLELNLPWYQLVGFPIGWLIDSSVQKTNKEKNKNKTTPVNNSYVIYIFLLI